MVNAISYRVRALSRRAFAIVVRGARRLFCTRRRRITFLLLITACVLFWKSLPAPLFDEPLSRLLLDRHGNLLGARIASDHQWRFPDSTSVPEKFRKAIMIYEDRRFDYHLGVDPLALARAIRLNFSHHRVVSGASTLTMQVIRLARGNPLRTYGEKLIEMALAVRLELGYSKKEILALYASHAPFGGNVVGLEAASWRYFGREPSQLSWAETCTLAVLPNSPALIHPGRNRIALKEKRDGLLRRLHEEGVIDAMALQLALNEPLPSAPKPMPRLAPHLLETLNSDYPQQNRFVSTLDRAIQQRLTDIVQRHGERLNRELIGNAAAIIIDNRTFEVIGYAGNSDDTMEDDSGHAIDLIRRPRSTGSILKPLLFAAMVQEGSILPTTLIPDLPTQYGSYMPENYDHSFRGAVPAREALAHSLNIPAVRMLKRYGVERFYAYLQQMGMTTLTRVPNDYGLTLILGGAEGTLWDLSGMYANLAHVATDQGSSRSHYRQLQLLIDHPPTDGKETELSAAAAWLTLDAMVEVARPGEEGYWRSFNSSQKVAWKTGTSYGLRDAWAIGITPRYTVGVWAGNASGEGRPGLTGVMAAAPLLFDIFSTLEPSTWFERPTQQMKQVNVCKDDGYLSNGSCDSEVEWIPRDSHFEQTTPYHLRIHLDRSERWRVDSRCEPVDRMVHRDWFILPPGQAFYYRKSHPGYRTMPAWRSDCYSNAVSAGELNPIALLYPGENARIYIPTELGGHQERVIFQAAHRDAGAILYWHLDDDYLGATQTFHQMALLPAPGMHTLTLVDENGQRLERRFEVMGKGQ